MAKAHGWAVLDDGQINVRTVSDTRRAALVNWLVTERNILILAQTSDEAIEALWHEACGDAICSTVSIVYPPA
jgi:hypothetical protein